MVPGVLSALSKSSQKFWGSQMALPATAEVDAKVRPFLQLLVPIFNPPVIFTPPANVLVAVVDVALIAATVGVEEETTFPLPFVVSTIFVPVYEKVADDVAVRAPMDAEPPEREEKIPETA